MSVNERYAGRQLLNNRFIRRYHLDDEIKSQMAELETKNLTVANFDANDSEVSMAFPTLRITDDVSILSLISLP